jgi:hypothetical protein
MDGEAQADGIPAEPEPPVKAAKKVATRGKKV